MKIAMLQDFFSKLPYLSQLNAKHAVEAIAATERQLRNTDEKARVAAQLQLQNSQSSIQTDTNRRHSRKWFRFGSHDNKQEDESTASTEQSATEQPNTQKGGKVDRYA